MGHDVFISHSSKDAPAADAACRRLEADGFRCWIAPRDILPGKDYGAAIVEGIRGARLFLLVLSARSNDSPQVKREVERAANSDLPIIPLRVENVTPSLALEYFISGSHWLDAMEPPLERHLDRLTDVVSRILGPGEAAGARPSPPTHVPLPTPARQSPLRRFWPVAAAVALLLAGGAGGWALFGLLEPAQLPEAKAQGYGTTTIFDRRAVPLPSARQLRLRAAPSGDAAVVALIAPDEVFRVAPRNGDWWPARLRSGDEGFVAHRWIRVIDEGAAPAAPAGSRSR